MCLNLCYRAVEEHKDLSCLWKLLGDACTLATQLPESCSYLCIRRWITNSSSGCEKESELVVLDKENLFQQGVR
jgi:hypothetical protein